MAKFRNRKKKVSQQKTRKELRKEKRIQKKENKRKFFSQKKQKYKEKKNEKTLDQSNSEIGFNDAGSEINSDFELSDEDVNKKLNSITKPTKDSTDRFHENQRKEKEKQKELEKKMRKRRITQLKAANEEEDREIHRLEKKLKIDKHKNDKSVHKMFGDGLDYALELCLPENIEKMYAAAKEAADIDEQDDDFEEDMAIALRENISQKKTNKNLEQRKMNESNKSRNSRLSKIERKYFKDDPESDVSGTDSEFEENDNQTSKEISDAEDNSEHSIEDSEFDAISNKDLEAQNQQSDENISENLETQQEQSDENMSNNSESLESQEVQSDKNISQNSEEESDSNEINRVQGSSTNFPDKEIWEDIYGRKRDKEGNIIKEIPQKYIPPHMRARLEASSGEDTKRKQKLERLKKQCKGLLNKLSEANMHKISSDIENLYMTNSRYDMNNTLSNLITEALVTNVLTKERMVLEYAMLITILHGNIGSEIGAHFLQDLVTKFHNLATKIETLPVENKELDNIIYLISHLYTFKIMQHTLIFEIINRLSEKLCEKSVECLLLLLRSVGFQLRKDDPSGLKEIILSIQKKSSTCSLDLKENPRLKFMLDVLNAIKNNNVNKIPQYDPSLAEHLKKILKSMLLNGKYIAALNITMDDLLRADEKGKWWVVGSAWSGNIKDIGAAQQSNSDKKETQKFSEKLLELAKQQRMNTEDRKNVFCIIMSAEDYVDAFERLLHLSIKDHRMIASIIIHCCLSEKLFNPYYAVLAQKCCEYDRKYQIAIQFASWDRIKDIHSATKTQIVNLAQFLLHLIVNGGLPISVLKIVEFAELDKVTLRLVRQIVLGLLLGKEEDCRQVFERIAPSTKLKTFKDSIRLFMHHFLLKSSSKSHVPNDQLELLKERISMVDRIISFVDSRVTF